MAYLGTFRGTGRVVVKDVDVGSVLYEIHVHQDDIPAGTIHNPRATLPGLKKARGEIEADLSAIQQVNAAQMAILHLDSGESIEFFITRWSFGSRSADIAVTGPFPWP